LVLYHPAAVFYLQQIEFDGENMKETLKKQKYRKYVLILLALILAVSFIKNFSIESKNSRLPDGQGNVLTGSQQVQYDSADQLTSNQGNIAQKPEVAQPVTVTLEIRCDTLSQDMSKLQTPGLEDYIPEDGVILPPTQYKGTTDNTVFDVLNTLCRNNDVQLEFSYTPIYESNYIEGIGYLYEFDGGPSSGWQYKVNGWFPNYGCSSYYIKDGDHIVWAYTCEGLGEDLGNSFE